MVATIVGANIATPPAVMLFNKKIQETASVCGIRSIAIHRKFYGCTHIRVEHAGLDLGSIDAIQHFCGTNVLGLHASNGNVCMRDGGRPSLSAVRTCAMF